MSYRYTTRGIDEILAEPKCLLPGDTVELQRTGKGGGRAFDTRPHLIDGPFVDLRYLGKAPVLDDPTSYDASFLIANQRVRGVGYNPVEHSNFRLRKTKPKGWHLNVCDPNLPTNDPRQNDHQPLPDFSVTDFRDFINQMAALWKIDLGWEWDAELF